MPCSFDYLIYPYYPAYTMGCYQIIIKDDNGRYAMLLFLCWFVPLTIAQRARKCNYVFCLLEVRFLPPLSKNRPRLFNVMVMLVGDGSKSI